MSQAQTHGLASDFTRGSIPRHLLLFSWPLLVGNLLQTLYNTVDTFWVGRFLGPQALGAVSVSFPVLFILISFVMGITMGTTVLVAQYFGAKDTVQVRRTVHNSFLLLFVLAVIMSIIGVLLHRPILRLIQTPPDLMDQASSYLNVIFIGLVFMFGYNAISAILRGLGDSRTPLRFLFYSTGINIILDPLMIFGVRPFPRMGIQGAALATIISQAISFWLAIRFLNRTSHLVALNLKELKFDPALTRLTIQVGLPAGLQQTIVALGNTVIMGVINTFGPMVVAAWGAASKIDAFTFMPSMSLGLATSALTGQNIGAGQEERVRQVVWWGTVLATVITGVLSVFIFFFPQELLGIFTTDRAVLATGTQCLRILALSYVPFGWMWVTNGALRGAGDTVVPMFITLFTLWLVRVPLAWFLSRQPALAERGIWIAMATSSVLSMILSRAYWSYGGWKGKAVTKLGQHVPEPDKA